MIQHSQYKTYTLFLQHHKVFVHSFIQECQSVLEHRSRSLILQFRKQNINDPLQEFLNELALMKCLVIQRAQRLLTMLRPQVAFDLLCCHFYADSEILDLDEFP